MNARYQILLACMAAVGLSVQVGCGPSFKPDVGVIVKGKIVKGGKPLEVTNREVGLGSIALSMVRTNLEPGELPDPPGTNTEPDGSFSFVHAGKGIKPGKYKLTIEQRDQGFGSDALQGAFSESNSKIELDVPKEKLGGTFDVGVIELDKYLAPSP